MNSQERLQLLRMPYFCITQANNQWLVDGNRMSERKIAKRRRKQDFINRLKRIALITSVISVVLVITVLLLHYKHRNSRWVDIFHKPAMKCCSTITCAEESGTCPFIKYEKSRECGKRSLSNNYYAKISGGSEALPGSWPWQAYVIQTMIGYHGKHKFCGGVIIDERFIMTAAHCFQTCYEKRAKTLANTIYVFVKVHNRSEKALISDEKVIRLRVCKVFIHEDFDAKSLVNDIALLELTTPLKIDAYLNKVCLPPKNVRYSLLQPGVVIGWGSEQENFYRTPKGSPILRELVTYVQHPSFCSSRFYRLFDYRTQLCAKSPGLQAPCQGDSGGPLMFATDDDIWFVGGIVSYGFGCGSVDYPDVYTNVAAYKDWIYRILRKEQNEENAFEIS